MYKLLLASIPLLVALGGCGVVEGIAGSVAGVIVREHETDHLICATAHMGEAISVSCVPRFALPSRESAE